MTMLISFLPNFIGRWYTAAGGRHRSIPPMAGGQGSALGPGSIPGVPAGREAYPTPYDIFYQTPCRNTGSFGV